MHIASLVRVLDNSQGSAEHLCAWRLRDIERGRQVLLELADAGLTLDLLSGLCGQLGEHLPRLPDPDAALHALGRYVLAVRSPLGLAALLLRDSSALPMLLAALSLGPSWAELLIADPEALDLLRQAENQPLDAAALRGDILAEVAAFADEKSIVAALARISRRQRLRIAFGEVVAGHHPQVAFQQLSALAESLVEAALAAAGRRALEIRPLPRLDPRRLRCSVIALSRLGGGELDHALPLELLIVYDPVGEDAATSRALHEHFDRVARLLARWLSAAHAGEGVCSVQLLALPDSSQIAAAHAVDDTAIGVESFGRTWHRQAMLSARSVAGDRELGQSLLDRLAAWLFRRYLSPPDETGIQALKRRIQMEATLHQDDWRDVRLARGGLRDLESTVAFLQLLVGGDQPAARQRGTLAALAGLEQAAAISATERTVLEASYLALRRLEHRLQILIGPSVTELPADPATCQWIAGALGGDWSAAQLETELKETEDRTWQTLRRLLDSAFPEHVPPPREVELLLDPAPPEEEIRAALAPFGFASPREALARLNDLAAEQVPFLSTRRCRHHLAAILPQLLCAIGATPRPDNTLDNLARVSRSLGGKGVLWELFRSSPPTLQLYVRLCAASPYLSDILTTNPGMIDDLLDSLQLDKLPTRSEMEATLAELCRGAGDTLPVLHDFKNAQHLRIGVRDILGKEDIDRTHEALADVAETCLAHVIEREYEKLVERFGVPTVGQAVSLPEEHIAPGPRWPLATPGDPCRLIVVGLGKLGGREPNYHSPLDLVFLYEAEGTTQPAGRSRRGERTANNHFFTQLAQRVLKTVQQLSPKGRLYAIEALLQPIGIGGSLAIALPDFARHFAGGAAPLWQWQALCQARPIWGEAAARQTAERLIQQLLIERPRCDADLEELRHRRLQLESGAAPQNLKRGPGGTLDVEFIVQMLQLENAAQRPGVLTTNAQHAVAALTAGGVLPAEMGERLGEAFRFLRRVESALRLLSAPARHDLPTDPLELAQLALLLGHSNPDRLRQQCLDYMADNRAIFDQLFHHEGSREEISH